MSHQLVQILLITSQLAFALPPMAVFTAERQQMPNTNLIDFGLTRPSLETTIYRTHGKHTNHYSTQVVQCFHYKF